MASIEEFAQLPREQRLARLACMPAELGEAVSGQSEAVLSRRPDGKNWAATEVICHLRDNEESFLLRLQQIMLMDEPRFATTNPDRWAEERQYLRNDPTAALAAFTRRRGETLAFLRGLKPDDWHRAGIHTDSRGRRTIDDFLSVIAWHDDNHLGQLRRALDGRP
ncbi:MAG TPA: DinB family protein [Methylomirabilota bacterium]|nr:DinB family protein [Methylomirabilota bacterium]